MPRAKHLLTSELVAILVDREPKPGCLSLIFQDYSSPGLVKNSHCQQGLHNKDEQKTILFGVHAQVSFMITAVPGLWEMFQTLSDGLIVAVAT